MTRRHRIVGDEVDEVIEGLKLRLWYHYRQRGDLLDAIVAFRVLYRLVEHRAGRPDYPEPIDWDVIVDLLNHIEK